MYIYIYLETVEKGDEAGIKKLKGQKEKENAVFTIIFKGNPVFIK